jgi:hypothetical protein
MAQSSVWLSLDQFVDEISTLRRPTAWEIFLLDAMLFGENSISNLLPILSVVRSFSHHDFIADNSNGIKVDRKRMNLLADNFWSHISWGSTGI